MKLKVGNATTYTVEIRELVINSDGEQVWALCVPDEKLILLDATIPREDRRKKLRHEYFHAVCETYPGQRADEETQAAFASSVSDDIDRVMEEMGGWGVLHALFARFYQSLAGTPAAARIADRLDNPIVLEDFEPVKQCENVEAPSGRSSGGRAQCGRCATIVSDAAIVTSKPDFSPFAHGRVVQRHLYCPHCDHVQVWTEGVTSYGEPNGAVVAEQKLIVEPRAVNDFLRKHPSAVGLIAGEG